MYVIGKEFVKELQQLIDVDIVDRAKVVSMKADQQGGTLMEVQIDARGPGDHHDSDDIYGLIEAQFKVIAKDPSFGCTKDCKNYSWPDCTENEIGDCILKMIDPQFAQTPTAPTAAAIQTNTPSSSDPTTIAVIVAVPIAVVLLAVVLIVYCRKKKQSDDKYSPFPAEHAPETNAYTPPAGVVS